MEKIKSFFILFQGADLIRVSKFFKESKHGKFVSYLHDDTRTLYDAFRKGAKESSKYKNTGLICFASQF